MLEELFNPSGYSFWILIISIIVGTIAIISRPFSSYVKFVYPNAKYETMGNPYVTEKKLNILIESKNLFDFKENLNSLKDYKIAGEDTFDIQNSIDNLLYKTIDMMKKDCSKKMYDFYNVFIEKIDMYYVKKELRNKLENNEVDEKNIERAFTPNIKKLIYNIKETNKDNLSHVLMDFGFNEDVEKELKNEKIDYLEIENKIDRHTINKFLKIKVPYKCDQGKNNFIKTYLDINNIKFLLRFKQIGFKKETCMKYFNGEGKEIAKWKYEQLSDMDGVGQIISGLEGTSYYNILKNSIEEYNKEKSVQILENRLDTLFLKILKDISIQNYTTIGPTLRFLIFKEYEIQNLKVIAKGIAEDLPKDIIKKFLILEGVK